MSDDESNEPEVEGETSPTEVATAEQGASDPPEVEQEDSGDPPVEAGEPPEESSSEGPSGELVTPKNQGPEPEGETAPPPEPAKLPKVACAQHSDQKATGSCEGCKRRYCYLCGGVQDGKSLCRTCRMAANPPRSYGRWLVIVLVFFSVGWLGTWLVMGGPSATLPDPPPEPETKTVAKTVARPTPPRPPKKAAPVQGKTVRFGLGDFKVFVPAQWRQLESVGQDHYIVTLGLRRYRVRIDTTPAYPWLTANILKRRLRFETWGEGPVRLPKLNIAPKKLTCRSWSYKTGKRHSALFLLTDTRILVLTWVPQMEKTPYLAAILNRLEMVPQRTLEVTYRLKYKMNAAQANAPVPAPLKASINALSSVLSQSRIKVPFVIPVGTSSMQEDASFRHLHARMLKDLILEYLKLTAPFPIYKTTKREDDEDDED